jgi:hypothetical protein
MSQSQKTPYQRMMSFGTKVYVHVFTMRAALTTIADIYFSGQEGAPFTTVKKSCQHRFWKICSVNTGFCSHVQSAATHVLCARHSTTSIKRRGATARASDQSPVLLRTNRALAGNWAAELRISFRVPDVSTSQTIFHKSVIGTANQVEKLLTINIHLLNYSD